MAERTSEDFAESIEYAKKHTAAATQQIIAAAPADPDWHLVVDFFSVGGDAAGTLQLLDDTNTAIDGYFWAYGQGGGVVLERAFLKKCPKGRGLRYTQTGGGNWSIIVKYHFEQRELP